MVFSDTTTNQGMIQECEFWVFGGDYGAVSGDTTLLQEFTRLLNLANRKTNAIIQNSDSRWQHDDKNYGTHPIATADLVAGQQDYILDDSHEKVLGVTILDVNGDEYVIRPIDIRDLFVGGIAPDEYHDTDGRPQFYDKLGEALFLYPAPTAAQTTLTNGLKVYYQREAEDFATTDTTKEPGFAPSYHRVLPLMASYDFATAQQMNDKAQLIRPELDDMVDLVQMHFSKRDKSDKTQLRARYRPAK